MLFSWRKVRNENSMTEAEAITIVIEQFAGPSGFVARLQRGQGIDAAAVHLAKQALQTLKEAWAERSTVPKEALLPLFDLMTTIRSTIELQPERTEEISRLAQDLTIQVAEILGGRVDTCLKKKRWPSCWNPFCGGFQFLIGLAPGRRTRPIKRERGPTGSGDPPTRLGRSLRGSQGGGRPHVRRA